MTRKLDALVAEKVMGRTVYMADTGGMERDPLLSDVRRPGDRTVPEFSTDIAAAWQVVEKMRERRIYLFLENDSKKGHGWDCTFEDGAKGIHVDADTAPLAICKAALRAVGVHRYDIIIAMEK